MDSSEHNPKTPGVPGADIPDAQTASDAVAAGEDAGATSTAIDPHPLREMVKIALPVVVAMTSYTLMQMVDKLMVSRIGPDPIYVGAQGNGGLASFIPISIVMGCLTVINTYVSQNLGNKTPERAPSYAWAGVWLGMIAWLFLIPYALSLESIFLALDHTPEHAAMEASYGRPLVLGAILTISARAFSQFFYGMHKPTVVLAAELGANVTNFVCNSFLIYGAQAPAPTGYAVIDSWFSFTASISQTLGIDRHGIAGAAYGTLIGTVVELLIPACVFLSAKYNRLYGTRRAWRPSVAHIKDILRIGWPGGLMFGNEMFCWAFFMVYLVGGFGEHHSNAGWIAHQWMSLSFMPAVGISVAITAVVGKCIGAKRPDLAAKRAYLGLGVASTYMAAMGLCFVLFRDEMVGIFISGETSAEDRAEILALGTKFMIAAATFQLFDGIAMSMSGALRGAGDTVWIGIVTVFLAWAVIVGGGLFMVKFFPDLGSVGPWMTASAYIICLSVIALGRFMSGRWKTIKLLNRSAPVAGH
jgi:MATE family multidrug resistance protein